MRPVMLRLLSGVLACISLVASSAVHALDPTRTIAEFHHTSWSIEDGVPADIWSIAQTPDGYLWLGSVNGLYRFDGVRAERIATDLLPSPSIHALAATPSGGLWIGYERPVGVISLLQDGAVTNFSINAQSSTSVHNIELGRDRSVWASTPDTILKFEGRQWRAIDSDWGTSLSEASGGVWAFGVARDGVVWSKNPNGLFFLRRGEARFVQARDYSGGDEGFTRTADGRLWTADSSRRLYALPDLNGAATAVPAAPQSIPVLEELQGPILLDRDGTLWCASFSDGGLRRLLALTRDVASNRQPQHLGTFTANDGLSSNLVRTLFEDREGNIWVGTSLGLDRFRPANVVTETRVPVGFRARFVESTQSALYAYTGWSNTRSRATDGSESLYRILPGQSPEVLVRNVGRLRGMYVNDETGAIWLTTSRGVQQLKEGTLAPPIALPDGVEGNFVYSAVQDASGAHWISVFNRGVFRQQQGAWKSVPVQSKFAATAVLIPDPGGSMWVRYSGGALFRVSGDTIEDLSRRGLDIGDITLIKADTRGLIVGGESGIARFDGEKFYSLHSSDVPALSVVTGIAETKDGSSWIFTQAGILRIDTADLESALRRSDGTQLRYQLLDPRDGLPGAPYGAVYGSTVATGPDGRVWFTTGQGLAWIDPSNLYRNPILPTVVVRSLVANDRVYDMPRNVQLPAGTTNLELDYTALSLTTPERNRFRYKLDGVDQHWVDASDRRQAFYTKLGPGEYRFHVIGSNNDGVWNEAGADIRFSIAPTFYQTRWFAGLCVAAGVGILSLLFMLRSRQIEARMRMRLQERLFERERIARDLHDTFLQGVQGLILKFQAVMTRLPEDQPPRQMLERALERADQLVAEGRSRVHDLRESTRATNDLPQALSAVTEEFAQASDTAFQVTTEGPLRHLHPIVREEAYRIGAEALANAFRHAVARNVNVQVGYLRNELSLRIADDGRGFDVAEIEKSSHGSHFGLAGLRERAARIHAQLEISSRPGLGSVVELRVPGAIAYRVHRATMDDAW